MDEPVTAPASSPPVPQSGTAPRDRARMLAAATVLLFLALGYLTIGGNVATPFSSYDDESQVSQEHNPLVHLDAPWHHVFTRFHYAQYVPVTLLTFRWNYGLFGADAPWSFRAGNWLIHAAGGLVLVYILGRLGLSRRQALFAAAAWTVHPLACESVAWITERSNCLAFLFGALGLAARLRWPGQWKGTVGAAAGFLLGLLSKPSALGWFPVFVAVEFLGGEEEATAEPPAGEQKVLFRLCGQAFTRRRLDLIGLRLLPLALLSVLFALVGVWREGVGILPPPGGHWYTALMTDTEVFARYVANILAPLHLSTFYSVEDIVSFGDPRLYIYSGVLAAVFAGSLWAARSRRRALLGWLWFAGAVAPNANLIGIVFLMADRYVYIATPGLLLVLNEAVLGLSARVQARWNARYEPARVLPVLAALYVGALGVLCAVRSTVWGTVAGSAPVGLFADAVAKEPRSGIARIYFGSQLARISDQFRALGLPHDPVRADELSAESLAQLIAAQSLPDSYRYFNPLQMRVTLAQQALRLGKTGLAREALRDYVPPPAPPQGPEYQLDDDSRRQGFRSMLEGGIVYKYTRRTLGEGFLVLADAELADLRAGRIPAEQAARRLRQALLWTARAAKENPSYRQIQVAQVAVLLAYDTDEKMYPALQAWTDAAVERARATEQALEYYSQHVQLIELFTPPLSLARERALGHLLLAEAGLLVVDSAERALPSGKEPGKDWLGQQRLRAGAALVEAQRALECDPSCSEAYFVMGRAYILYGRLFQLAGEPDNAELHLHQAAETFGKVDPKSPVAPLARIFVEQIRAAGVNK